MVFFRIIGRLVHVIAFRLLASTPMAKTLCNKCRQSVCLLNDSWCVGSAAQENSLVELRERWGCADLRRAANDLLVDAARQIKILRSISLCVEPVKSEEGVSSGARGKCAGAIPKVAGAAREASGGGARL